MIIGAPAKPRLRFTKNHIKKCKIVHTSTKFQFNAKYPSKIEMYRWDVMEGDVHVYTFPSKNIENDLNIFSI